MLARIPVRLICACAAVLVFGAAFAEESPVDWSSAERLFDGIDLVHLSYEKPRLIKALALRIDLGKKSLAFTGSTVFLSASRRPKALMFDCTTTFPIAMTLF